MGIILKLDDHLTNMIAAGEVVERPMGVVKELVENAIDAKATRIEVTIVEGGLSSIVVSDNGIGMDPQDASRAFERHSTSKIKESQDLWSISTLGFRGEALPSIASVSRVVCMTNDGETATRVEIHFGKLISVVPYACPVGTHISVEGLFLKTPARLKHMKSVQYETAMIVDVIEKFTLCYPDVAFVLTCDAKVVVQTNGSGSLKEVVYRKYGNDIARNVVEFSKQSYDFSLSGAIVLPHVSRSSRNDMILFANRRLIRSIRLQRAIMQAYKYYLPEDRYPIVILNVHMDHQLVDVNVHPSKWEIRLSKEQQAELFITETIEEVLKQHMSAAVIRQQVFRPVTTEIISFFPTPDEKPVESVKESEIRYGISDTSGRDEEKIVDEHATQYKNVFIQMTALAQLHHKYILAQGEAGLYILDQHAAMERIRYEHYQKQLLHGDQSMQPLLIPVIIEGRKKSRIRFDELAQLLLTMKIELEMLSDSQFIVRQLPVWMSEIDAQAAIEDLFESFENDVWQDEGSLRKAAIASLACHSSVRFNQNLSVSEMQSIIDGLGKCQQPYHCPHGRPTFVLIDANRLLKEFNR
ncbi:MAG: DNA mismatch repair protein MutL [Firmicutes bacterium HGW-Firmicutes-20]|jgi:DNA mismatch repair protein MutL|nr:MAG: DNA mismatch repair protein MutL [Firmicutes bacterium HGW-Firmicutes-20]PKM88580.1 MAG: DNA mismatch repair protein MutL [Firmicutes bacterium HGW-Firmicutes-10]